MRRLTTVIGFLVVAALGCASAAPATPDPPPDSSPEVALHIGEKAQVRGEIVVTFVGVAQDSRCPKGDQCIQAGKATVKLEATPRGGETVAFELDTARQRETEIAGFRIELKGLEPYPVSSRSTAPGDYVAKLHVDR